MVRGIVLILITVLVLVGLFVALRPDPPAEGPRERTAEIEVRSDTMDPSEVVVGEGDTVRLEISGERPAELHLHGYDLEAEVEPGETAVLEFEATLTGRFEVEDHETHEELGVLIVEPRAAG
jgi:hypothetical protein